MGDDNFIVTGPPVRLRLTNGFAEISQRKGTYEAVAIGDENGFVYEVPDDNGIYYARQLRLQGLITFLSNGAGIQAGTNIVFTTNNNNNATIIINAGGVDTNSVLVIVSNSLPEMIISARGTNNGLSSLVNDGAMFGPDTPGTLTYGIQEAINALPTVLGVTNGIAGGGRLRFRPGKFLVSTNIMIPARHPFTLTMEGAGWNNTILKYTGPTNAAMITTSRTNDQYNTGVNTTNFVHFFANGIAFTASTNAASPIVRLADHAYTKFQSCLFAQYDSLTNGAGGITLCVEATTPKTVPGLVGVYLDPTTANEFDLFEDCYFYGLACGIYAGGHTYVNNCWFSDIGYYCNSADVAACQGGLGVYNDTLWRGQFVNCAASSDGDNRKFVINTGAALCIMSPDGICQIQNSIFFTCGAVAYLHGCDEGNTPKSAVFRNNDYTLCPYRFLTHAASPSGAFDYGGEWAYTWLGAVTATIDSYVTNSAIKVSPSHTNLAPGLIHEFRVNGNQSGWYFGGGTITATNNIATNTIRTTVAVPFDGNPGRSTTNIDFYAKDTATGDDHLQVSIFGNPNDPDAMWANGTIYVSGGTVASNRIYDLHLATNALVGAGLVDSSYSAALMPFYTSNGLTTTIVSNAGNATYGYISATGGNSFWSTNAIASGAISNLYGGRVDINGLLYSTDNVDPAGHGYRVLGSRGSDGYVNWFSDNNFGVAGSAYLGADGSWHSAAGLGDGPAAYNANQLTTNNAQDRLEIIRSSYQTQNVFVVDAAGPISVTNFGYANSNMMLIYSNSLVVVGALKAWDHITNYGTLGVGGTANFTNAVVAQATMVINTNQASFGSNVFTIAMGTNQQIYTLETNKGVITYRGAKFVATNESAASLMTTISNAGYIALTNGSGQWSDYGLFGGARISGDFQVNSTAYLAGLQVGGFSAGSRITQVVDGTVRIKNNANGAGTGFWQSGGDCFLASNATSTGTTLAGISWNNGNPSLTSGRNYSFELVLFFNDGLAADGIKVDFGGGSAAATTFRAHGFGSGVTPITMTTAQVSSLTTVINGAAVTTDDECLIIKGFFKPSGDGTFQPRFAKNADAAGATLTVYAGSHMKIRDMP